MQNITVNKNKIENGIFRVTTCTGCSACANICPVNAIKLEENEIGYYQPIIDEEKCVHCGKCEKVCPEITPIKGNTTKPEVYACQANDDIRYVSSSGGVFTLLAEEILSKGGYVAGVGFDENWKVHHMIINSIEELDKLRRSKYVQSYIREDFYKELEKLLKNDNYVLFSGCPCQAAGLRSYLGKNYDKLYIVDLLCAQSASPKVYRKFLEDNYYGEEIKSINFRSKIKGWDAHTVVITDQHPQEEITHNFMRAYVPHLTMNECCKNCKYTTTSRQGDITIGDYWGIGKRAPHLDDRKGTSCVLINTEKGKQIFNKIKSKFKLTEKRTLKDAIKSNWVLKQSFKAHPNIDIFNKNMDTKNFNENTIDCLSNKYTAGVIGFWYIPNRGAILTNYALNQVVNELGYKCKTINYVPDKFIKKYKGSIAENFANKYLDLTREIINPNELVSLNKNVGTFICGSDQIWRFLFKKDPFGYLFLNFVNKNNKMISYSTSFGTEKYDGPESARTYMRHYLSKFDAISVREDQAVKILKEDFNIEGIQVIDPVFLISKEKYDNLINNSTKNDKNYIAYYFIWENSEKQKLLEKTKKALNNMKTINIAGEKNVEDWLYYIKNCEILITDSFHGTCFATIFNKKFIAVNPVKEKPTRFETILKITNMMDRFLYTPAEIENKEYLFEDIDWTEANKNLEKEIIRGKNWLREALNKPRKELTEEQRFADYLLNKDQIIQNNIYSTLKIINNKHKIYFKYYFAKIFYNITFGPVKKKLQNQKNKYKPMIRKLRELKGNI